MRPRQARRLGHDRIACAALRCSLREAATAAAHPGSGLVAQGPHASGSRRSRCGASGFAVNAMAARCKIAAPRPNAPDEPGFRSQYGACTAGIPACELLERLALPLPPVSARLPCRAVAMNPPLDGPREARPDVGSSPVESSAASISRSKHGLVFVGRVNSRDRLQPAAPTKAAGSAAKARRTEASRSPAAWCRASRTIAVTAAPTLRRKAFSSPSPDGGKVNTVSWQ